MKRSSFIFAWVIIFLTGWLGIPNQVRAFAPGMWQILGSQNELWTTDGGQVTGYSQHHFITSYFVTNPENQSVPSDFHFRFDFTPLQGVDHNFVWDFLDEANYYQAHFNGGAVWISRFIGGQEMLSVAKNFSIAAGQTYHIDLSQIGNRIVLTINGTEVSAFTDLTHNANSRGSVGFKLSPGAIAPVESRFENILIDDPLVTRLPIERLSQFDDRWLDREYDTAHTWSNMPTIGRWGCTLTSLTMILRSYGLTTMVDGRVVDPNTVNEWLNNQPDGYVGQGLVNWFAAMRLVREISDRYSVPGNELPKLEFSYAGLSNWQTMAQGEIAAGRPLIAEVPGHFPVVNGFDARSQDFLITDPLYEDYQFLSQHPPVKSLRLFRPSHTDLSALVVIHKPIVTVTIKNASGEVVSQTWEESIIPFGGGGTEPRRFTAVFKPATGAYRIEVTGAEQDGDLQVFSYDQTANLQLLTPSQTDVANFASFTLPIVFAKETGGQVGSAFSWDAFMQRLVELHDQNQLTQAQFDRLNVLAQFAQTADETTWSRYKNYLRKILDVFGNETDTQVKTELLLLLE